MPTHGNHNPPVKTLLIAACAPGQHNVGGILLEEMLGARPVGSTVCAAFTAGHGERQVGRSDVALFDAPVESMSRPFAGRLGSAVASGSRWWNVRKWLNQAEHQVRELVDRHDVQQIWAVLDSTTVIQLADRLQLRMSLPIYAQVWDDAAYLCGQRRLDPLTRRRVLRSFARVLSRSERTAVICEAMAEDYKRRFLARCTVVRHGLSESLAAQTAPASPHEFRIGVSGGMYCHTAWSALLDALQQLNWRLADKPVRIRLMTDQVKLKHSGPAHIEYLGWRPQPQALRLLADCDLMYLPQPFEPELRELARLSFPTKLSAYVSTGRPVFVHAPEYASVPGFCRTYAIGPVCQSIDPTAVAESLQKFTDSPERYAQAANETTRVARTILSRNVFLRQLDQFLGAGEAARPLSNRPPESNPPDQTVPSNGAVSPRECVATNLH